MQSLPLLFPLFFSFKVWADYFGHSVILGIASQDFFLPELNNIRE
jgi:hypothetical protein